jgi:hypothetical protein
MRTLLYFAAGVVALMLSNGPFWESFESLCIFVACNVVAYVIDTILF